jgi:hypothetical protein
MQLGHSLTRSVLTYPEVSSKVCHNSFCQLQNSVSLPWVIYYAVLLTQYCAGGKIKKNEMGWVCGACGGGERCAQGFVREA